MTLRPPASIQLRLIAWLLGGFAIVWLATAVATWRDVHHELGELLDAHLAQAAALLVVRQGNELEHDDDRTVDAPSLHRHAPRVVFQVFHEGQLVLRSADAPLTPLGPPGREGADGFLDVVDDAGHGWRVFATHGPDRDLRVFVAERVKARDEILRSALRNALGPLTLALPLVAILAWWAVRSALAPLRALRTRLAARAASDLQPLATADAPTEIAPLIDALNGLLARIGAMVQSERRFTADAAHELRTPIAAIRTQAQVALAERDDALRAHALQATLAGCDRASRLIDQLLTLSRLEAGAQVRRERVDLAALARQIVGEMAPRALDKDQDLGLEVPGPSLVEGDPTLLGVLLRNLVDNALRYSPPGARVTVTAGCAPEHSPTAAAGTALLRIDDSGPGLDAAVAHRLGDRFHRGLGHGESGSGLGWSIVQRIAQVHGLTVQAASSAELGGLSVTLTQAPAAA